MSRSLPSACLLLALLLPLAPASTAAEPPRVLVVTGDDYCPVSCNPASGYKGVGYELTRAIFEPLGWRVEYQFLPWQRGLKYFREGRVDLLPGVPRDDTPELRDAQFAGTPLMAPRMCFYTRRGLDWHYRGTDSLLNGRLGVIAGYYYWPELRDYLAAHRDDERVTTLGAGNSMELAISMLARGRIDYFAELRPAVDYQLAAQHLQQKIREADCLDPFPLYLAFRPDLPAAAELMAAWDRDYPAFLESPAGQAILARYGLSLRSVRD